MQKRIVIYLSALIIFLQVPVLVGVIDARFILLGLYDLYSWAFFTALVLIFSAISYGFCHFLNLAWWFPGLVVIIFYLTGKAFLDQGSWVPDSLEISLYLMIVTTISVVGYFVTRNTRGRLG